MSDQKQPEPKPDRVLRADCTHEEFGLINWAARQKKGRNVAQFLREALEQKVEAEAEDFERMGRILRRLLEISAAGFAGRFFRSTVGATSL